MIFKIAIGLLLLWILCAGGMAVRADAPTETPTPTPTLRPIPPSPTSMYLYLRPTPTMFTLTTPEYHLTISIDAGPIADNVINIYRAYNHDHVIDFIGSLAMVLVAVGYVVRLVNRFTRDV